MRETRPLQAENAHPQAENGLRQSAGKGCILHVCTDGRAKSFMRVGWPDRQHDVAWAPDLNQQRLPDVHGLLTPGLRKLEEQFLLRKQFPQGLFMEGQGVSTRF